VGPVVWSMVNSQRSTLTEPRPGLGGPRLGRIWAELGRAGPATWRTLALPRCLLVFETGSRPQGVAHGGHGSAVYGRPRGLRWTASTLFSSLTVHVHRVHRSSSHVPPPPLFLPAVRRRRRAPTCSTWWRSRTDPSGPMALLGLQEGDKGVLAADLSS
jgi:hypothetical protein